MLSVALALPVCMADPCRPRPLRPVAVLAVMALGRRVGGRLALQRLQPCTSGHISVSTSGCAREGPSLQARTPSRAQLLRNHPLDAGRLSVHTCKAPDASTSLSAAARGRLPTHPHLSSVTSSVTTCRGYSVLVRCDARIALADACNTNANALRCCCGLTNLTDPIVRAMGHTHVPTAGHAVQAITLLRGQCSPYKLHSPLPWHPRAVGHA